MKSKLISIIIENKYFILIFSIGFIIDYFNFNINSKYLYSVVLLSILIFEIIKNEEKFNYKISDLVKKILYCVLVLLLLFSILFILFDISLIETIFCDKTDDEDLAKGILEFSKGENVKLNNQEAINYLIIFWANSFGNSLGKKSFSDRIAWIVLAKNEVDNKKLNESKDKLIELEEISKSNIGEIFNLSYEKYVEYLDGLTPDKIVCLINIIIGGITFSSFLSVLSIMLSDNIINRIKFLDKYPRILKLLKIRNIINKKITKLHLFMHFIWIVIGLLCNIYMFFL